MCSTFTLFGATFYPYSLLMIVGAMLCFLLLFFVTMRRHRECFQENLYVLVAFVVVALLALAGAVVLDSLLKWSERGAFVLRGATFYGGLLCALALYPLALLCIRRRQVPVYTRLCELAACIPAGHCLGRIGCFLGGCCFGKPTGGVWGVVFPGGSAPYEFYGGAVPLHPVQLYEAAFLLALFFVLFFWLKKDALPFYCLLYGIWRFGIEFLRADDRGSLFGLPLSPSQVISLALFVLGAALLAGRMVRARRQAGKEACGEGEALR